MYTSKLEYYWEELYYIPLLDSEVLFGICPIVFLFILKGFSYKSYSFYFCIYFLIRLLFEYMILFTYIDTIYIYDIIHIYDYYSTDINKYYQRIALEQYKSILHRPQQIPGSY